MSETPTWRDGIRNDHYQGVVGVVVDVDHGEAIRGEVIGVINRIDIELN